MNALNDIAYNANIDHKFHTFFVSNVVPCVTQSTFYRTVQEGTVIDDESVQCQYYYKET